MSLLSRSDFSIRLQLGLSERVVVFWCSSSETRVNAYENPLSASQETSCVLDNITRLLILLSIQNFRFFVVAP